MSLRANLFLFGLSLGLSFFVSVSTLPAASASHEGDTSLMRTAIQHSGEVQSPTIKEYPADESIRERKEFERVFFELTAEQRVRVWKEARQYPQYSEEALIAKGMDTVPFLEAIVRDRNEDLFHRWRAMRVLCDMDRFVPLGGLLISQFEGAGLVGLEGQKGRINVFVPVTGRRIGEAAFRTLSWAADQTVDRELRIHARELLGLLAEDLRPLPLEEKVRRWARAIERNLGDVGGVAAPDQYLVGQTLKQQLVEAAPESLPLLIELIATTASGYVRESTISMFQEIDIRRVRLRSSALGQRAIEASHAAIQQGNLMPVYRKQSDRKQWWEALSKQFFHDEWYLSPSCDLTMLISAGEILSGAAITDREAIRASLVPRDVTREFATFLTSLDPYFPSWEYVYQRNSVHDQMLHPRFRAKVDRVFSEWKRFIASKEQQSKPE